MLVDMGYSLTLASVIFGMLVCCVRWRFHLAGTFFRPVGRSASCSSSAGVSVVGLTLLWLTSRVPAESTALRIALLSGYLLTFGLGFNGISPVYASAVSDRFSGGNLGTILGLLDLGSGSGRRRVRGGPDGCSIATAVTAASSSVLPWRW